MERRELAKAYHKQGYSCSQSVLAAFSDLTGLGEQQSLNLAGGFGRGAGTGELCGAISAAIMVLGCLTPVDQAEPVASKNRSVALSAAMQAAFSKRWEATRCGELLEKRETGEIKESCEDFIAAAVEITEQLLAERK